MSFKALFKHYKLIAAVVWLVTTVSLATWWLIFGLGQIDRISEIQSESAQMIARQHRMLMSEGAFLVGLLLLGGVALLSYAVKERSRARQVQMFFAAFTHDLKTAIASLRLQAEALEEDVKGNETSPLLQRLIRDTVRLELQLENSLYLADASRKDLLLEEIDLVTVIERLKYDWPRLRIEIQGDAKLHVDRRALESILRNLFQNSVVHGKANVVTLVCQPQGSAYEILIKDDGVGFTGDVRKLGEAFSRHSVSSGSGIGIYLAKSLAARMLGRLDVVGSAVGEASSSAPKRKSEESGCQQKSEPVRQALSFQLRLPGAKV